MSRSLSRCLSLGLLLGGCSNDTAVWAMQHASVEVTGDSIVGYQTWEFYGKRWKKDQDEKYHLCARVQELQGQLTAELEGCPGCSATYELTVTELETDCPAGLATDDNYAAVSHFALGDVDPAIAPDDPYPGKSLGWYLTWDAAVVDAMGFAWDERHDPDAVDATTVTPGWNTEQRYVLWPAYAWELR